MSGFASHPRSNFFIPRIKGLAEEAVKRLDFARLVIYRPGLLRLEAGRNREESRFLEGIARFVSDYADLGNWWSISTANLAQVICNKSIDGDDSRLEVLDHAQIVALI